VGGQNYERLEPEGWRRAQAIVRTLKQSVTEQGWPTFEVPHRHWALMRLQRWVAANGALHLTLRKAASISHLEPHYFSVTFHRDLGLTFREWRQSYRIAFAIGAIESGQVPIKYVVQMVGYRDRRALERAIKRSTGATPAELQRTANRGEPHGHN
jgi:AraC-like DNA-binding protein